jgi:cytidine deaminase
MMDFNQIYKMAVDMINYIAASRGFIEPNTTVCVILAQSGRVYNGVSQNEVHAEIDAVRNMQRFNENAIEALILVDANSRLALLPCPNCIRYMISLNPINTNAMVNMPDRPVPFQEILAQNPVAQPGPYNSVQQLVSVSATRSSMVVTGRSKSSLLSGKVSDLLSVAEEEEQTDEDLELMNELTESTQKKKGGLLGGLFGKK